MSEELWLRETDPLKLLELCYPMCSHGSTKPQARRSRLYLLACARKQWTRLPDVGRAIIGLAEEYAENPREQKRLYYGAAPVTEQLFHSAGTALDLRYAELNLATAEIGYGAPDPNSVGRHPSFTDEQWRGVTALLYLSFDARTPPYVWVPWYLHDVDLLRDVHGNPFQYVPFPQAWRTDTVLAFARQMYDSRDFSAMPIFADALEDAGCDNQEMLSHCRCGRRHARGCWVLDLVLEK